MAKYVTVSLLHPMGYRASKDAEIIRYPMGAVRMPLEHAQAMQVTRRIISKEEAEAAEEQAASLPFGGAFDEKLRHTLESAGYKTLADLAALDRDAIMALGVGPANYERITSALKGIPSTPQE